MRRDRLNAKATEGAVAELEAQKREAEIDRFRKELALSNTAAREKAMERPPLATVRAYRGVYGRDPRGGPPAFRFIVPGSGFFHLIARAFDAAGQSTADDEQFFTSASCTQQIDVTPPEVTPTVTGTVGNSGWYTSDVTVTWLVEDPESDITDAIGCAPTTMTSTPPA